MVDFVELIAYFWKDRLFQFIIEHWSFISECWAKSMGGGKGAFIIKRVKIVLAREFVKYSENLSWVYDFFD